VFVTSGAVLVLEILAGRLMAPYVGISLETFTGIIGTMLAGIAVGSAVGGRLADRHDPDRLIGPALIVGGVLAWVSIPIVSLLGPRFDASIPAIVTLALFAFFAPALVLSAIGPMVAKLRLADLDNTGEVVGGLSAAGTAGALFGTFLTGFVLVSAAPTRVVVVVLGLGLALWGGWHTATRGGVAVASGPGSAALCIAAFGLAFTAPTPCEFESAYSCGRIVVDADDNSRRTLVLDNVNHGAVDLDQPTHLEFRYVKVMGAAIDQLPPGPIDALHIGGGAFSLPAYVAATRPGSTQLVLELDPALVDVAERDLGLEVGPNLQVETGDARLVLGRLETDAYDLIVGDAFGGLTVPWHLTTTEFVAELDRVLRPDGVYVMNVIDGGANRFSRAELATLAAHFEHRAAIIVDAVDDTGRIDETVTNQVLMASDRPLAAVDLDRAIAIPIADIDAFVGDAGTLSDDFAPVDQLAANP
jgi:MFS family permease